MWWRVVPRLNSNVSARMVVFGALVMAVQVSLLETQFYNSQSKILLLSSLPPFSTLIVLVNVLFPLLLSMFFVTEKATEDLCVTLCCGSVCPEFSFHSFADMVPTPLDSSICNCF